MKKVFIEGGGRAYADMFRKFGWVIIDNPREANLIQLTGGADVHPTMYNKNPHHTTHFNLGRDLKCLSLWFISQSKGIPIAGICRGAQFLHVMNGGELVQDCNNHAVGGGHDAIKSDGTTIQVSSTHHQMMASADVGEVLMWADNLSTRKETTTDVNNEQPADILMPLGIDIESMYYEKTNSLSYQPHPEFFEAGDCLNTYMEYVNKYLIK